MTAIIFSPNKNWNMVLGAELRTESKSIALMDGIPESINEKRCISMNADAAVLRNFPSIILGEKTKNLLFND